MQRIRNLDIASLRSVVTIAETGNMTRAASQLHMTQSAVSMQIKRLENLLEFRIFNRSPKGIAATPEGEQLIQYARNMVRSNDEALTRLTSPDFEGEVSLGVPCDILNPYIPRLLKNFGRLFPRVQVNLASANTVVLKEQFAKGEFDIILTTEDKPSEGSRTIVKMPLCWIGADQGTVWKNRPLPIGMASNCAFRKSSLAALQQAGIAWYEPIASDDDKVIEAMIAADLCVGAQMAFPESHGITSLAHQGELPALPEYAIAMYKSRNAGDAVLDALSDQIVAAYQL